MPAKKLKRNVRTGAARKSTPVKVAKSAKKTASRAGAAKKATRSAAPAKAKRPPAKASKSTPKKAAKALKAPAKKATKAVGAKATRAPAKATKSAPPRPSAGAKTAPKKSALKAPTKASVGPAVKAHAPKSAAPAAKSAPAPAKAAPPRPPIRPPRPEPKRLEVGYTDEKFLAHQKTALERERATYMEQANSLQAEADLLIAEMEPGDIQFDEESGEGGTVAVDRERDLALSAQALEAVAEIDAALEKIATGKYGICENCGQLIAKARIEALPYARLCIACKSGGLSRR